MKSVIVIIVIEAEEAGHKLPQAHEDAEWDPNHQHEHRELRPKHADRID